MDIFLDMPELFPLMRGGGAFLAAIGLGILIGSFGNRRFRTVALIAGAALGVALMAVLGATKIAFDGLPYPQWWQWAFLGLAFVVEGWLVSIVVRTHPRHRVTPLLALDAVHRRRALPDPAAQSRSDLRTARPGVHGQRA